MYELVIVFPGSTQIIFSVSTAQADKIRQRLANSPNSFIRK